MRIPDHRTVIDDEFIASIFSDGIVVVQFFNITSKMISVYNWVARCKIDIPLFAHAPYFALGRKSQSSHYVHPVGMYRVVRNLFRLPHRISLDTHCLDLKFLNGYDYDHFNPEEIYCRLKPTFRRSALGQGVATSVSIDLDAGYTLLKNAYRPPRNIKVLRHQCTRRITAIHDHGIVTFPTNVTPSGFHTYLIDDIDGFTRNLMPDFM